jgi:hypothetical protein
LDVILPSSRPMVAPSSMAELAPCAKYGIIG